MAVIELVMGSTQRITIAREVLLFEIERRCPFIGCNERVFIGLTKTEAVNYCGFKCGACDHWTPDDLTRDDVPNWWDEIRPNAETAH